MTGDEGGGENRKTMNPPLIDAIRRRLREQTTEQLLALWVTNDRVMWSPEAFEAVKSLLAERGVSNLPPQNDPAPIAAKHSPATDPAVQYWFAWLRPVLWIAIAVSSAGMAFQAVVALDAWIERGRAAFRMDDLLAMLVGVGTTILLPAWLLVASIACLRLIPVARTLLIVFAWAALLAGAFRIVHGAVTLPWSASWSRAATYLLSSVVSILQGLTLPAVLLLLLRRPEIRSIFTPARGPGFEASPALRHE